jgi:hypothetical protein
MTGRSAVESITPRRGFDDVILPPATQSALWKTGTWKTGTGRKYPNEPLCEIYLSRA